MVRIMIVDDHALIRRVVRGVVEGESDMEVVGEACDGREAEVQAMQAQPDVVLMDLDLPGCDGFEATERILACSPHSHIVILTASYHEQHIFSAIQSGAVGYLTKDIEPDALIHAIRCAARDELCIPRPLANRVLAHIRSLQLSTNTGTASREMSLTGGQARFRGSELIQVRGGQRAAAQPEQATALHPLTEREREILDLIRRGHKNREIAGELCVAESTIHKHVQNILDKLHARNRTEAIYLTRESAAAKSL
jgi:two-component system nitrate/nitrite response regulator NarL